MKSSLYFFLCCLPLCLFAASANDVIINEYNDNGGATGVKNGIDMSLEWVELLVVNGPVDLRNWYITDEEWTNLSTSPGEGILQIGTSALFSSIASGVYVVLVKGSGTDDTDASDGDMILYSGNSNLTSHRSFSLSKDADGLALVEDDDQIPGEKDAGEVPVDYVSWGSEIDVPPGLTWASAITGTEDEDSYFSNGSNFNNDAAAHWVTNAESAGLTNRTPGAVNPGQNDSSLPVEISSFAGLPQNGAVVLRWETECEINNQGFVLDRSLSSGSEPVFRTIADYRYQPSLTGHGFTSRKTTYEFRDENVLAGNTYLYRLSSVDQDGRIHRCGRIQVQARASGVILHPPYPNPFNPQTQILLEVGTGTSVEITISNLLGQTVYPLRRGYLPPGEYTLRWDGRDLQGHALPSGLYFLEVREENREPAVRQKLILVR